MVMQSLRSGKAGGFMKYILFTLLGMAVGGLALSGSFNTGGVSSNDVAKIEDKTINIRQFHGTLQRALSRYGISPEQAYKIGMTNEILTGEIRANFLLKEAENLGIEINKDQLAKRIAQVVRPYVEDDESMQESLEKLLRKQGMNERDFVDGIRKEMSGDIVMTSLRTGFSPSTDLLAKDLYMFQAQTRDIEIILFPDNEIETIEPATDEQLERLYNALRVQNYKIPEYRSVSVATFDPGAVKVEFSVSDEEVKAAYEDHIGSFLVGEQFVLSQAIVREEKDAYDVYNLVKEGKSLKAALTMTVGENGQYLENVPFEMKSMLPALVEALKDRKIGKTVPPTKTSLGYHVVNLVDILPPSTRPFEAVKNAIKEDLLKVKTSDYLYKIAKSFDELLNDGLTFEEISKEINISISTIDFIDEKGMSKQGENGLPAFGMGDKKSIIEAIFEIEEETPPVMQELTNGQFIAFALKSKEEENFKPFEVVKAEIEEKFMADQRGAENELRMQKYLAEISTKGSTFESIAAGNGKEIRKIDNITVGGDIAEPLNDDTRPLIFKTVYGGYEALSLDGQSALIRISGYGLPELNENDLEKIRGIKANLGEEIKDEAFLMYLHMLSGKYRATINDKLLERVYGQGDGSN